MYLKKPSLEEKKEVLAIIKETKEFDQNFEGARDLNTITDYNAWLEKLVKYENPKTCPKHLVPGTTYLAMEGNRVLGVINIRWYLNEALKKHGGHIGYFIRPSERGKGHGTKMLALALEKVKEKGINKVMITCRKANIVSARVMEKNGGVYDDDYILDDNTVYKRYWIKLK